MNEDNDLLIENCPVCNSDIIIDSCSIYEYPTTRNYIWRFFCRKCGLFRLDIHKEYCSSIDLAIKYYNGLVEQARKIKEENDG